MTKIFSFIKITPGSIIASARIATHLSDLLGAKIHADEHVADGPTDTLIIVNGAYAFTGNVILGALASAIEEADKIIWVQNDFTIIPQKHTGAATSPFRKAFRLRHERGKGAPIYWTTVKNMSRPGLSRSGHLIGDCSRYMNWNALAMLDDPTVSGEVDRRPYRDRMVYYGSFRKTRKPYFDRYFMDPATKTTISSPTKKFEAEYLSPKVTHAPKFRELYTDLNLYGLGLYIEDQKSHDEYHSPANRFYEMLSARVPMVFQPESRGMLKLAGYDVSPWVVHSSKDIENAMDRQCEIQAQQFNEFHGTAIAERRELDIDIMNAWKVAND